MSGFAKGILATIVVGLVVGLTLLLLEYGIFVPAERAADQGTIAIDSAEESSAPAGNSPDPAPVDEAQVTNETEPVPQAPDNQTFTDYRIEVVGTKLSSTEYSSTSPPGYYMKVFTAAGEVLWGDGCYAHLELFNNDVLLTTGDIKCGLKGGWSTSWWPNDTKLADGSVRVTASITSDWGATAYTETTFVVRTP